MLESLGLSRRIHANNPALSEIYHPWSDYARQYESEVIIGTSTQQFAKSAAIRGLHQDLLNNSAGPETGDLLKALLTDQRLLFPQTREREYEPHRSMESYSKKKIDYHIKAEKRADPKLSEADRILLFAKHAYDKRQKSFDETYPLITFEKVEQGIHTLIDGHKGPFHLQQSNKYSIGDCKGDLGRINCAESPGEAEYCMRKWIETTRLCWGDSEWLSNNVMQQNLNFTTVELFEFLAEILLKCFSEDDIQRELLAEADYFPSINSAQLNLFREQIEQYRQEDLSQWTKALPVLEQYLYPDFTQFENGCTSGKIDSNDSMLKALRFKLANAFLTYCDRMEPVSSEGNDSTYENRKYEMCRMAEWYLTCTPSNSSSDHLLFAEYPHLIFQLFRSPVHRYIFNYENRGWNFKRVIEDAYIKNPFPITNQSLEADRKLFLTIVDACAEICKSRNITFYRDAWIALWECIAQSVQCLSYKECDLFSARNGFIHVLYLQEKGSPILDKWIEQELTLEAQNYIPIWHRLHKKYCDLSRKETGKWNEKLSIFRGFFESATTSGDDIYDYLSELWNSKYLTHTY